MRMLLILRFSTLLLGGRVRFTAAVKLLFICCYIGFVVFVSAQVKALLGL